jgi:hypothetical protein
MFHSSQLGTSAALEQQEHSMELVGGETPETTEQRPVLMFLAGFAPAKPIKAGPLVS